jgi:hypothetical protein
VAHFHPASRHPAENGLETGASGSGTQVAQAVGMARIRRFARLALLVGSAIVLGCTGNVVGGGQGGGGGQGTQTDTGTTACTAYAGDGCTPGTSQSCGYDGPESTLTMECELVPDKECTTQWNYEDCDTPLVLSFDGAPVEYLADREHAFDVNGTRSVVTDWPTARTPWLALDRNGNGLIDDGGELFGSMTRLSDGRRAANGFAALRELDADGDGRITPADPGFARLLVWSDRDGDRRSFPAEVAPASAWELLSIDLDFTSDPRCDARANCEVERASFRYRDATGKVRTGAVVDVHLAPQRW